MSAGRGLSLTVVDGVTALGEAASPSYGFVSVGAATTNGVVNGSASADVGANTALTAGTDLAVSALEQQALFLEPALRVNRNRQAVEAAGRRMFDRRRAFDLRE